MHEFSLASSMLEQIGGYVTDRAQLLEVRVTVGPLCGVCVPALETAFEFLARDQGYAAARLVVHEIPATYRCESCGRSYDTVDLGAGCPSCASSDRTMLRGREFYIESLEVGE